jgi:hypothetical protein
MVTKKTSILRDNKAFNKFCQKENRVFNCKGRYECTVACPLYRARHVEYLMNEKGMTLGDAHRSTIREGIPHEEALKIIREKILEVINEHS